MKLNKVKAFIGVFDQGLISLSNLLIGLVLINYVSKSDYGAYVLANAIILLILGLSNGLINTQMSVNFAGKADVKKYCQSMLGSLVLVILVFSLLISAVAYALYFLSFIETSTAKIIYAIALSSISVLMHEFFRRYYLLSSDTASVLIIDIIYLVFMFMGVMLLNYFSVQEMYIKVIYVYGISTLIAALFALYRTRLYFIQSYKVIKRVIVESWLHGKWAIGGVVVTWLQSQSYIILLALLVAAEGVADANASRLFLSPIALVIMSLAKIYMPRMALMKQDIGVTGILKYTNNITFFLSLMIIVYGCCMYFVSPYIIDKLMGDEYGDLSFYVLIWVGVFFVQAFRVNYSIVLQVIKEFRLITINIFISAIVVLFVSVLMISIYGVSGSIFSLLIGEALLVILFYRKLMYAK